MKTRFQVASYFIASIILCSALTGCATAKPKPATVGDKVGSVIDKSITWTSKSIQKVLNREQY